MIHNARGGVPLRCNIKGQPYFLYLEFDSNSTSAPDGLNPTQGITLARSDVGDLTITFDEAIKPREIHWGSVNVESNSAELSAKYSGYTASTGVVTINLYDEDDTSGIAASADSNNIRYSVLLLCNRSQLGDD